MSHGHTTPQFRGLGRDQVTLPEELTPVDRHRDEILAAVDPLDPIDLKISDALGLVLAADVNSSEPVPAFANSAMDGYAVIAADVAAATSDQPVRLQVAGEVAPGARSLPHLEQGTALRIMTGAPLPPGADAIVPVEVTGDAHGDSIAVFRPSAAGEYVRSVGEDIRAGQGLLRAGHRLRAQDIGLFAAVGQSRVRCHPAPRVVIMSTGNELVPFERRPGPGRIRDVNGPMLAAQVRDAGALPFSAGIVRDDRKALMHAVDSNLGHADLMVATGGASAGAYDLVRDAIGALGDVRSLKVAMKPGMPQIFGQIRDVPVFGLPGNPVSAFVSFEVFVRPVLRALQGRRDLHRPTVEAALDRLVETPPHKRTYLRVRLARRRDGRLVASPTGPQGSHVLTSVVQADGLAEIPADTTVAQRGQLVTVRLLVGP